MKYAFEDKELAVNLCGKCYHVRLERKSYGNRRIAIVGVDAVDGERFSTLSVNLPEHVLNDDEIFIKSYSENEALAEAARNSGYFEDTGRRVQSGFVTIEIWKMKKEK